MIDEDLDAELGRLSSEERVSKAALVRRFLRQHLRPLPPLSADALTQMIGADAFDPAPVDEIVYE